MSAAPPQCLADSKSFDNSILCTNESTLIAEEPIADRMVSELGRAGAAVLDAEATDRIRAACYPEGRINTDLAGKSAAALAEAAGIRVPSGTRVLVAPFAMVVPEEPLAHEKLFPLLGMVRVPDAAARHRRRLRAVADRRRRPLGGDPLSDRRRRSSPTAPRCGCCASASTRRAAPARPASTPTFR